MEYGISELPINLEKIYADHDWILLSHSEARKILKTDDPLNVKKRGADARTAYLWGESGTFVTIYDESSWPTERRYFTIAHEIGHIILGHFDDFGQAALSRGGLTKKEYNVLEKEADQFASELLMPSTILKHLGISSADDIVRICKVSKWAAATKASYLHRNRDPYLEPKILSLFKDFISPKAVCARNLSVGFYLKRKAWEGNMRHEFVETDENGRFYWCPRCGNNSFSDNARYCKICGLKLFNYCSKTPEEEIEVCGNLNPGDARYCEYCGHPTMLMVAGLLKPWDEDEADNEAASTYDFNDDIPF